LNRSVRYLAIFHDAGDLADPASLDIDLLTEDYYILHTILNGGPLMCVRPTKGGRFPLVINRLKLRIGVRFPGDNYLDADWMRHLLATRQLDTRDCYRVSPDQEFYVWAYHALVHKRSLDAGSKQRLESMAADHGIDGWTQAALDDERQAATLLREFLEQHGWSSARPLDPAVFYNCRLKNERPSMSRDTILRINSAVAVMAQRLGGSVQTIYWYLRDGMLMRAPWLSKVKHTLRPGR
jgi:hypothetical protein